MRFIALVLGTSFLAACGGGGGGGGAGNGGTPAGASAPTAILNSSNQAVAAQETTTASFMPLTATQTLTGAQATDESVLFSLARAQMDKLPAIMAQAKTNSTLTGVVQSQTANCDYGGTLTIIGSDADNNGVVSAGDSVTITSNGCTMTQGTLYGTLGFVINTANGTFNSTNFSAGMTMTFDNFSVSSAQFSGKANGSLTFSISATGLNKSSASVSTPSLSVSGTYAGVTRSSSMTNYSATFTRAPDPVYTYVTSYTLNGLLTSSALSSQAIAFATSTPFVRRATDLYPSSGVMVITGASNSKVRLTALSNTQASIELDANGDGTYESSTLVNWNTLM